MTAKDEAEAMAERGVVVGAHAHRLAERGAGTAATLREIDAEAPDPGKATAPW